MNSKDKWKLSAKHDKRLVSHYWKSPLSLRKTRQKPAKKEKWQGQWAALSSSTPGRKSSFLQGFQNWGASSKGTQCTAPRHSPPQQLSTSLSSNHLQLTANSRHHSTSYGNCLTKWISSQYHLVRSPLSPLSPRHLFTWWLLSGWDPEVHPELSATSLCLPAPSAICSIKSGLSIHSM